MTSPMSAVFAHYHCPCITTRIAADPASTPTATVILATPAPADAVTLDALPLPSHHRPPGANPTDAAYLLAQPLSRLLFCEDCHRLKCHRCTQHDIVCYFCPNCLFEVPTASVKGERNRCMRNCFACPVCESTLTVVAEESTLTTVSGATSTTVGRYYLTCGCCRFDSRTIAGNPQSGGATSVQGWTFERPTGLAAVAQREDDARDDVAEFERLRDKMDRIVRGANNNSSAHASGLDAPGKLSGLGKTPSRAGSDAGSVVDELLRYARRDTRSGTFSRQKMGAGLGTMQEDALMESEGMDILDDDNAESRAIQELMALTDVHQISTLEQRYNQLGDQPYTIGEIRPSRIHLRAKRSRRCRSCRHVLVKPEQKAIATRFKISLIAMHYVPVVTIQQFLSPLQVGETSRVVVKFSNPIYFGVEIEAVVAAGHPSKARLLVSKFEVGDYSDMWEYEEELASLGAKSLAAAATAGRNTGRSGREGRGQSLAAGIWEQKSNSTSVLLELTPTVATESLQLDVWVKYTYEEVPEDEDELSDQDGSDNSDDGSGDGDGNGDGSKKEAAVDGDGKSKRDEVEGIVKTNAFWVTLGLGSVEVVKESGGKADEAPLPQTPGKLVLIK